MSSCNIFKSVVIIGANGCIGQFLTNIISPVAEKLHLIDPSYTTHSDNKSSCDLINCENTIKNNLLSESTLIIIATSFAVFSRLTDSILKFIPDDCLLIDTTSVKLETLNHYNKILTASNRNLEILSIDPLFKPDASLSKKPIAYFSLNASSQTKSFIALLEKSNCQPFISTAEEHDQALSIVQTATHAVTLLLGDTIAHSNINYDTLQKYATPPFKILLLVLRRIVEGTPEVYWDIQANNVYADNIRTQLLDNLNKLSRLSSKEKLGEFSEMIKNIEEATKSKEKPKSTLLEIAELL